MKWVFKLIAIIKGKILKAKYDSYKKELDSYKMELSEEDVAVLRDKFSKFLETLTPAQIVFFAHFDLEKTLGELAFYELMNRDAEFKKSFQRQEIEALAAYFIKGYPYSISEFPAKDRSVFIEGDRINDLKHVFVLKPSEWKSLKDRFINHCKAVFKVEKKDDEVQAQ